MSLLDFLDTDQGRLGLGLLAAAGPRSDGMGFGGRVQEAFAGQDAYRRAKMQDTERLDEREFRRLQIDGIKRKAEQEQQQAQEQQRVRGLLSSGEQVDYQGLIRQGVPFELVKQLADSRNLGRDKVARTAEIEGPNGAKMVQGFDDYGQPVGAGVNGYVAPVSVNQGDKTSFVKPLAGLSLPMGMSPEARDASARGWAGVNQSAARLQFDKAGGAASVNPIKQGPMSVTLQKELLESDDVAQSSAAVIDTLTNAKKINSTAYSGYAAKGRAVLASNMPWNSAGADATINLDNMMTGQALESLKSLFGGMPTEGERKILLEMQASAEKTPEQRAAIMERGIAAAKRRGDYANKKAQAIRSGTYLTEGISQNPAPKDDTDVGAPPKPAAMPSLPPANTSNKGRRIKDTETGKVLISNGMTWVAQ